MEMIRVSEAQKEQIIGVEYTPNVYCAPVEDVNGDWFISKKEADALNITGEEKEFVAPPNPPIDLT